MTIHFLDLLILDDNNQNEQQLRKIKRRDDTKELNDKEQYLKQQENQLKTKEYQLLQREEDLMRREIIVSEKIQDLKLYAPKVWQQIEKERRQEQQNTTGYNATDGGIINLAQQQGNTTEQMEVNPSDMPETSKASASPAGSLLMICGAILLCVTSALCYRKKDSQN